MHFQKSYTNLAQILLLCGVTVLCIIRTAVADCTSGQYYAHEKHCSEFFYCEAGVKIRLHCANDLQWHQQKQHCDLAENVNCAKAVTLTPEALNAVCPLADNPAAQPYFAPYPNDCARYLSCTNGVATALECPLGLLWNTQQNRCDYAFFVDCKKSDIASDDADHDSDAENTTATTATPATSTSPLTSTSATDSTTSTTVSVESTSKADSTTSSSDNDGTTIVTSLSTTATPIITTELTTTTPIITTTATELTTTTPIITTIATETETPAASTTSRTSTLSTTPAITTTTQDPRTPYQAPECNGENNNNKFAALDCRQYYQCFNSYAYLVNCRDGYIYSASDALCVRSDQTEC